MVGKPSIFLYPTTNPFLSESVVVLYADQGFIFTRTPPTNPFLSESVVVFCAHQSFVFTFIDTDHIIQPSDLKKAAIEVVQTDHPKARLTAFGLHQQRDQATGPALRSEMDDVDCTQRFLFVE